MNLAKQLETANLSIPELELLIKTLESTQKNVEDTLKRVSAYEDLKKNLEIIADIKPEENPKMNFTFSWNGEDVTLFQILEYQKSFKEIVEKLKLITTL